MENPMIYPTNKITYKLDPYRHVVLFIFCVYCAFVGLFVNPYAPIAGALNRAFGITVSQILSTMIFFLIGKIISAPLSGIMLEKIGIKPGIYISLLLMIIGCYLRMQMDLAFEFVLLAQFTLGLSAALVVSSQLKLLYEWCHPSTRGYFTTIVSFSFIIGGGIGLVFILFFVKDTEKNVEIIKEQMASFDSAHLVFVLFLAIVHTIFFLSKPRSGFGYVPVTAETNVEENELVEATEKAEASPLSTMDKLRELFAQPLFVKYLTIYVGINCVNNIVMSILVIMYDEFGITGVRKGVLVGVVLTCGVLGSMRFMQIYLPSPDNKYYFTQSLILSCIFGILAVAAMALNLPFLIILMMQACYGFVFFLAVPVSLEYILRNVKKTPLTFINGFLFFFGQSFACICLFINKLFYNFFSEDKKHFAIYCTNAFTSLIMVLVIIVSRR